jgi:hypothetical protein
MIHLYFSCAKHDKEAPGKYYHEAGILQLFTRESLAENDKYGDNQGDYL